MILKTKKESILTISMLLVLLISCFPLLLTSGQTVPNASVVGQNLQRTYYSPGTAPNTANLLWKFQMNGPPGEFSTAIANGVVYQGCLGTGDVYAINQLTGQQIWHRALNNTANSMTYYNGLVYTQGGSLPYDANLRSFGDEWIALDANTGNIVWIYKVPASEWLSTDVGTYGAAPVIVDGKMYINVNNGIVTLNASTGVEISRWNDVVPVSFFEAYSNGNLYGVNRNSTDGKYYAFSGNPETKTLNWISKDNPVSPFGFADVGAGTFSGVAFSDDLFVAEYNFTSQNAINHLYRIRVSDGVIGWVFPTVGYPGNALAMAYNNVYAATYAGNVYCTSKIEGTSPVWTTKIGPVQTPIVVADQKVFIGSEDASIYVLDAFNGSIIWTYRTGGALIGSPVVADGNLYIAGRDQYLYAFGPAPAKPTSTITITAPSTTTSNQPLTIQGTLTNAQGAPIVLASVTLQQRIVPRTEWTDIATVTTDANGAYTYTWTAPVDGIYDLNAVFNGDSSAASTSATDTISIGSTESTIDAINKLQTTLVLLLALIIVITLVAVILSALALKQSRRKT
jgi:outer membrane protein assembly factor BamB